MLHVVRMLQPFCTSTARLPSASAISSPPPSCFGRAFATPTAISGHHPQGHRAEGERLVYNWLILGSPPKKPQRNGLPPGSADALNNGTPSAVPATPRSTQRKGCSDRREGRADWREGRVDWPWANLSRGVLVRCASGCSRSPVVVMTFLMMKQQIRRLPLT